MKKGIIYSHQAWTDTINLLSLPGYYAKKYDLVKVTVIDKMYENVRFALKNLENVEILKILESDHDLEKTGKKSLYDIWQENGVDKEDYDLLIHGWSDWYRKPEDKYKDIYPKLWQTDHPIKGLYTHYDIDFIEKINCFNITRDLEKEEEVYNDFISKIGTDNYILVHSDPTRNFGVPLQIHNFDNSKKYINLHGLADNIFHTIKILEKSSEIHFIDSVWAAFCYLLDAKYSLFKSKPIFLHPLINRFGGLILSHNSNFHKLEPIELVNWKIINNFR